MNKKIKKINCLALSFVIFVMSLSVGSVNVKAGSCTHNFIYDVYYDDTTVGHIQTCTLCGVTSGEVSAHSLKTSSDERQLICSVCGHTRIKSINTYDGSYATQAAKGVGDSGMYRYNLSNTGITNPESANPYGQNAYVIGKEHAVFCDFQELEGTGVESDPYIINDVLTLYRVLASGGTNYSASLYFKLGCDIDLGNKQWLDMDERWIGNSYTVYKYKAFNGILDGNGHTINGLYTSVNDSAAGFIPVLGENGVIKNLHVKNTSVNNTNSVGSKGALVGTAVSGSQIIGCSAENCGSNNLVGKAYGSIVNSYFITSGNSSTYYNAEGNVVTANEVMAASGDVWYAAGEELPRLINFAETLKFADINGDGVAEEYDAADIVALKNHLMWAEGYDNVYGDVDRNGVTDITDLAILQRHLASDYDRIDDGFWRNIELENFGIYYTDDDNYDFARKLELYFKNNIGITVEKQKATAPSQYAIVLKKDATLNTDYTVAYDNKNAVLTFSGKSFTAVEQAVLDFIANSDYKTSTVYETQSGILSAEKQSVTINGKQYYYAWGDEFDGGSIVDGNTTVNYGKWDVRDMGSDPTVGSGNNSTFRNLKFADDIGLSELNVVENGKLTMHRGVGYGAAHVGESTGYLTNLSKPSTFDNNDIATSGVLYTKHSMLFKRGYLEMQCTLPSDGYSFPAWWLMTNAGNNNPEVDRSLYSKVYEFNEDYDKAFYYTPDNYKTYKYKLPGATYEIDIFEIIQYPTVSIKYSFYGDYVAKPNKTHTLQYTLHKWYTHSKTVKGNNLPLKVYELDWVNLNKSTGFTQILDATHDDSKYVENWATLDCHEENMKSGSVNADITRSYNSPYSRSEFDEKFTVDMNNQINAKIGLLWDETQISQYIWFEGATTPIINKIKISDLGYDNADFDPEQYAYMLMENHLFTHNGGTILPTSLTEFGDCTMVVDYVRLYQLDGERDIVTSETEAFNNPENRFN
ncbi:MAG: dockerin type I repeat-containing protein [Clostridia bacterium]|nr:dockerin type I repeat-containing protein [Clostridia bacterium]